VEDPIEFVHESKKCLINQREVGPHTLSFQNALRSALREDPDVILVVKCAIWNHPSGDVRGGNRASGVRHAAHQFGGQDIDRIIDVFPADEKEMVRAMLSESLRAVISQALLKTKDGTGRWRHMRS